MTFVLLYLAHVCVTTTLLQSYLFPKRSVSAPLWSSEQLDVLVGSRICRLSFTASPTAHLSLSLPICLTGYVAGTDPASLCANSTTVQPSAEDEKPSQGSQEKRTHS